MNIVFCKDCVFFKENICTKIGTSVIEGDFCSKAVEKEKEFDFITAKKTIQAVLNHEKIKNPFFHYSYSIEEIAEAILRGNPNDIMIKELEPFYLITTYYHLKKNPLTTGKLVLIIAGMTFSVKFIEEKGIRHFHSFTRN